MHNSVKAHDTQFKQYPFQFHHILWKTRYISYNKHNTLFKMSIRIADCTNRCESICMAKLASYI